MNIRGCWILVAVVVTGCRCGSPVTPELSLNIVQKDATLDHVVGLSSGRTFFGIDSATGKLRVKVKFNTRSTIYCGDRAPDGRTFFADIGEVGKWGSQVIVLDRNCNIATKIECNPLPHAPIIFGDNILVSSSTVAEGDQYPLQAFSLNFYAQTCELKLRREVFKQMFTNDRKYGYAALMAVNQAHPGWQNYLLRFDIETLDTVHIDSIYSSFLNSSAARMEPLVSGSAIVCAFFRSHKIEKRDLASGVLLAACTLDQSNLIPHGNMFLSSPTANSDGTYSFLLASAYGTPRSQTIVTLDGADLSLKSAIALDTTFKVDYDIVAYTPNFLVTASSGEGATVFNRTTGTLAAHYDE